MSYKLICTKVLNSALFLSLVACASGNAKKLQWIEKNKYSHNLYEELPNKLKELLDKKIANKKFVYLGEGDHYIHEKYPYRLAFIKYLASRGFTHLGMEMGRADALNINRYLQTGDSSYFKMVGLYGHRYFDPKNSPATPIGTQVGQRAEEKRFFEEVRNILTIDGKTLHYFGFDLDMYPGAGHHDIEAHLKRHLNHPVIKKIHQQVEESKTTSLEKRAQLLTSASHLLNESRNRLLTIMTEQEYLDFRIDLKVLADSFMFDHLIASGRNNEHMEWREQRMIENMPLILQELPKNARFILMGHNAHLSKSTEGMVYESKEESSPIDSAIGAWISDEYSNQVYSIWSNAAKGEHRGFECPKEVFCTYDLNPQSFDSKLYSLSQKTPFFFELNKEVFPESDQLKVGSIGVSLINGHISKYADAYYFIPKSTRMRE